MKGFNLSAWALRHQALVQYLFVMLLLSGVYAYSQLGQMEDPEFTFKVMIVQVDWPGATTQEMEEQVTNRIERKLQEVSYLDHLKSYSKPGESVIFVELKGSTPAAQVPDIWYEVRKKVGDIQGSLPAGVQGPYFNDEFGDTFGSVLALTADGFSYAELNEYAKDMRQTLLQVPDVSKVNILGAQAERIYIEFSHHKLASLKLDPSLLLQILQEQNAVSSAGAVNTDSDKVFLRVSGDFDSVESIRNIGIEVNEQRFRLGDIATVYRDYIDPPVFKARYDGQEAIILALSMRDGGDVIALGEHLQRNLQQIQEHLPVGIEVHQVSNQPEVVERSIHEFLKVLGEAVVIVLVVSFVSLGLRTGLVVALSIPLVLAVTFTLMWLFGIDLQRISLGALIIALGLLVDDAMIAVEMMALKLEQGWHRLRAATFAYESTAFPMLTGTLITAAAFLPVGIAKSNAGEYTFSIFAVVTMALLVSWVVAVVFIPFLGYHLLPAPHENSDMEHGIEHDVYQGKFYRGVRLLVNMCVRFRKTVMLLTLLMFISAVYGFKFVEQQFFPSSNRPELLVELTLAEGASFAATETEVKQLEAMLSKDEDIAFYVSYIGGGSPRFYLPMDLKLQNTNFAQLMIMTKGNEARERVLQRLNTVFAEQFPSVRGRVARLENGLSVGYPLQFRVLGDDLQALRHWADQVAATMRAQAGVTNVHFDWNEQTKMVRIEVDQDKARSLGISSQALSTALNSYLNGMDITEYRERDELISVVARAAEKERGTLSNLMQLNISLGNGQFVPLEQIAYIHYGFEEGIIWRRNRQRVITVRADVAEGLQAPDLTNALWPKMQQIQTEMPYGYQIQSGGASEESRKSQESIGAVMPLMLVIVMSLLMLQLQSFQRTLLVFITAPLGIIGMTLFLLLLDRPFGFVAMLGAISLGGMIMRNSVILVDQIEQDKSEGKPAWEAIVESTVRRFRPIMLTAAAAILAMIPLSHSIFWGPMAVAIMGGLLVATVLTLFFLPALYAAWFRVKPSA